MVDQKKDRGPRMVEKRKRIGEGGGLRAKNLSGKKRKMPKTKRDRPDAKRSSFISGRKGYQE